MKTVGQETCQQSLLIWPFEQQMDWSSLESPPSHRYHYSWYSACCKGDIRGDVKTWVFGKLSVKKWQILEQQIVTGSKTCPKHRERTTLFWKCPHVFLLKRLERSDFHILKHSILACWCQCDLCSPWRSGITNRPVDCKMRILPSAWDVCSPQSWWKIASWKKQSGKSIQESGCYIFFK